MIYQNNYFFDFIFSKIGLISSNDLETKFFEEKIDFFY